MIHFKRGVLKAAGTQEFPDSVHTRMRQLSFCQSKAEYYELIELLKGNILGIY